MCRFLEKEKYVFLKDILQVMSSHICPLFFKLWTFGVSRQTKMIDIKKGQFFKILTVDVSDYKIWM